MTTGDYESIAAKLKEVLDRLGRDDARHRERPAVYDAAEALAELFGRDPEFDRRRFLEACGLPWYKGGGT
jgi:hypothetical protein